MDTQIEELTDTLDEMATIIDKDNLPRHVYYAVSRRSFIVRAIGNTDCNTRTPTKGGMKQFHVRLRAFDAVAEMELQRKRALHYHKTGEILPEPKLKRARRASKATRGASTAPESEAEGQPEGGD